MENLSEKLMKDFGILYVVSRGCGVPQDSIWSRGLETFLSGGYNVSLF